MLSQARSYTTELAARLSENAHKGVIWAQPRGALTPIIQVCVRPCVPWVVVGTHAVSGRHTWRFWVVQKVRGRPKMVFMDGFSD